MAVGSLVSPRLLSLSLFTFFTSSIVGLLVLFPVVPLLPGEGDRGEQCLLLAVLVAQ